MSKTLTIAMVGLSGFGGSHVNRFLDASDEYNIRIVGAIDVNPERCTRLQDLKKAGVEIYSSLEMFYETGKKADLVVIASPIHFHAQQTQTALKNGSNVLCEKPAAARIQDAMKMANTAKAAGKLLAIGYQWSFSTAIQALKRDVMDGVFGEPVCLKTFINWPRAASYYKDRHWAARVKSDEGAWILDSPVHNATAHYLHNCFYILGRTTELSAMPVDIQAELYRANPIQNYDTAALRAHTEDGAEIVFYTSHAVPSNIGPVISYEFEKATVVYESQGDNAFIARFKDGNAKSYGNPDDGRKEKTWTTVAAVREGKESLCGILAAIPQMLCANGAQESMEVASFPEKMIGKQGSADNPVTVANGLQSVLLQCFNLGILPYEHSNISWAQESKVIDLRNYTHFPGK